MNIAIKNMVCNRCIAAVKTIFEKENISVSEVELGQVETVQHLSEIELQQLNLQLKTAGFEILTDQSAKQIQKIKNIVLELISTEDIPESFILSDYLSEKLNREYSSISKVFSAHQETTLEQYFILQKIEKVKELIIYDELNFSEIAGKLGYKSVQHLSSQFKKMTGFTPTEFKNLKKKNRISIDQF